ncbi:MAG: hypothetical protein JEZ09_06175 [Salinivirgaceae bacterium]|nr:hypothetical protein [Salinivirgaceae bacterium]
MLPKFLIADNSQDSLGKLFVVHTESPKFILEGSDDDFSEDQVIHWLEDVSLSDEESSELIGKAEAFLDAELANQEDLYDDMED